MSSSNNNTSTTKGTRSPYDNPERLDFCKKQRVVYGWIPMIRSNLPAFVKIGVEVSIHEGVMFTEGFGYARDKDGRWLHIPHVGGVSIGNNVDIYPGTTINRGTVNDTVIGSGTKIDHKCHIGHNSRIGENCIICAGVIICGSVVIGDGVWISPGSTIRNKIVVGNDVFIDDNTNVVKNIPDHNYAKGNPVRFEYRDELPHNKIG